MSSKKDAMADSHDAPRPRSSDVHDPGPDPATSDDRDDSQETVLETSFGAEGSPTGPDATEAEDETDRGVGATSVSSPSFGPSGGASGISGASGASASVPARSVGSKTLFGLGDGGLPFPGLAKSLADLRAGYAESLARTEGTGRAEGTPTTQFPAVASPAAPDFLSEVTDALNAQARLARARALGGQAGDPAADSISGPGHRNIREATGESTGNWSVGTAARVSSWVEAEFEDPDDGPTLLTPGIISITEDAFEAPVLEPAPGVDTDTGATGPGAIQAATRSGEEPIVIGMPNDEALVTVVPREDSVTVVPVAAAEVRVGSDSAADEAVKEIAESPPWEEGQSSPAESARAGELREPAWADAVPPGTGGGSLGGFAATASATAAEAADSATGGEIATAAEAAAAAGATLEPSPISAHAAAPVVNDDPTDEPPSDTQIDARLARFGGAEGTTPIPEPEPVSPGFATDTSTGEPGWFAPRWSPASPIPSAHAAAPSTQAAGAPGNATPTGTPTQGRPSVPTLAIPTGSASVPRTNTPLSSIATLPAPPLVSADGKRLTLPPGTPAMGIPDRAQTTPKVNLRKASLAAIVGGAFAGGVLVGVLVGRGGGASAHGTADVALVSAPSSPAVATGTRPGAATPATAPVAAASTSTVAPIPAAPASAATAAATPTAPAAAIVSPSPSIAAIAVPAPPAPSSQAPAVGSEPGRAPASSNAPTVVPTTAGQHLARTTAPGAPRSQSPRTGTHAKRLASGGGEATSAGPRTAPAPLVPLAAQAPAAASPSSASKPAVAGRPQATAAPKSTAPSKPSGPVAKASVAKSSPPKGPWHDPFAD
jgi:hypothetical protein